MKTFYLVIFLTFCSNVWCLNVQRAAKDRYGTDEVHLNGGCEDKIPNCNSYLSMCCAMKDSLNVTCPKTCRFCSETPSAPGGGVPGGIAAPTASTGQDPCSPDSPPSATVDVPGQTTTTQSSIPGISMPELPGQTTATTQSSIPGGGGVPGMG